MKYLTVFLVFAMLAAMAVAAPHYYGDDYGHNPSNRPTGCGPSGYGACGGYGYGNQRPHGGYGHGHGGPSIGHYGGHGTYGVYGDGGYGLYGGDWGYGSYARDGFPIDDGDFEVYGSLSVGL